MYRKEPGAWEDSFNKSIVTKRGRLGGRKVSAGGWGASCADVKGAGAGSGLCWTAAAAWPGGLPAG